MKSNIATTLDKICATCVFKVQEYGCSYCINDKNKDNDKSNYVHPLQSCPSHEFGKFTNKDYPELAEIHQTDFFADNSHKSFRYFIAVKTLLSNDPNRFNF